MTKFYFINSRRIFLKNSLALGTLLVSSLYKPSIGYSDCTLSPKESSGPFYPLSFPIDQDNDLTYLNNKSLSAEGEIIYIKGLVQNESCEPISNALVEIWQACSTGRYNHPDDKNSAKIDPNFQYWGKAITPKKNQWKKIVKQAVATLTTPEKFTIGSYQAIVYNFNTLSYERI